mgnify:CR=1 FL=1
MPYKETLRIVQLIDSLEPGGAERMAINYANALAERTDFSGLIATRAEGDLKKTLKTAVPYLFLNRTAKGEVKAWFEGAKYLKQHNITHLQAHGSSLFFAILLKLTRPSLQIIWHDHLGKRPEQKRNLSIQIGSFFVTKVLVVNTELEQWAKKKLWCKNILRVANFTTPTYEVKQTFLKGNEGKRIVCLANLKPPKNHYFILESFKESGIHELGWTLHFVGKDFKDLYARQLKAYIQEQQLTEKVFFYGSCADIQHILNQAQAGILGSTYEGFPLVLLEYGLAGLAVLATDVGYNAQLIQPEYTGWLLPSNEKESAVKALVDLANNPEKSNTLAHNLKQLVTTKFSKEKVMQDVIAFITH